MMEGAFVQQHHRPRRWGSGPLRFFLGKQSVKKKRKGRREDPGEEQEGFSSSPVAGGAEGRKGKALTREAERVDRGGIKAREDGRGEGRDRGKGQRTQLLLDDDVATRSLDGQHRGRYSCAGGGCQMGLRGVTDSEDVVTVFTVSLVGARWEVVEGYRRFLLYFRLFSWLVLLAGSGCFLLSAFCGFSEGDGQQGEGLRRRGRGSTGQEGMFV